MPHMFSKFKGLFSTDIGIDLGTANSLVYMRGRGIVLREPSVVAIEKDTKNVIAVGADAKRMLGRTPGNIVAIRPMKLGVIADFDITEAMLRDFLRKIQPRRIWARYGKPRVVIAVPSGITEVEKRAVEDAAHAAGMGQVFLVEEPMAAAVGVGMSSLPGAGGASAGATLGLMGSVFAGGSALGYVVVGLLGLALGAAVTVLAYRLGRERKPAAPVVAKKPEDTVPGEEGREP